MTNRLAPLVALALAGILVAAPSPAPRGRQSTPTPLQLFQKLLPVVRHPRCSNCHGGMDPRSPAHPGRQEVLTGSSCETCHTDVKVWELPSSGHFFPGLSDKQLCALFSDFAAKQGHPLFISNHIKGDELIGAAFLGDMGGARDTMTTPASRPPIGRPAFIALAQDWLARGQGACVVDGTITQEESIDTIEAWTTGNVDWERKQKGTRTVTITLSAGQFRADIKLDGSNVLTQVQHLNVRGAPCNVMSITVETYSGSATGPATIVTKDTLLFADTKAPGKDYRIDVTLPTETTRRVETNTALDQCGLGIRAGDGDTQSFDWPGWTFTIEGHLDDPKYPHLFGACDKTIHSGDLGVQGNINTCFRYIGVGLQEPWLMNHAAAASNHDGSDVPFRVMTYWNIAYKP